MNQFKKGLVSLSLGVLITSSFVPSMSVAASVKSAKSTKAVTIKKKGSSSDSGIEPSVVERGGKSEKKGKEGKKRGATLKLTPEMLTKDYDQELDRVRGELSGQEKLIREKRKALGELNLDGLELDLEIKRVDKVAKLTYEKIQRTNKEIRETEREIEQVTLEISELEKELKSREGEFRERIKASSRTGFLNYMEVVLGADSFPEMLSRFSNIQRVVKTDNKVIEEYIALSVELDAKQKKNKELSKTLTKKVSELTKIRADLLKENEGNKSEFSGVKGKKDRLLREYRDLKLSYKEKSALLDKLEEQSDLMKEFKRQAVLLAKREKLRKKKEDAAKTNDAYVIVDAGSEKASHGKVSKKKAGKKTNQEKADEFLEDESDFDIDLSDSSLSTGDFGLNPYLELKRVELISKASKIGIDLITTSGLRTFAEQTRLYNQGRTTPGGIVTNARAGESWHNWGFAFDVAFDNGSGKATWNEYDMNDNGLDDWQEIGAIGRSIGLEWGGDWDSFQDRPHFEYTFGKTISEMMATRGL